ncbi:unnamed protein product [Pocillopora meandrina]|uniref:MENTAL domain-containing protein n=1 Tax=Pocillopora meandrina TaxID=46732 RepID=A0AAU9XPG3_9CNID|nr:unnamed protein product [Pocillopora meandrina]
MMMSSLVSQDYDAESGSHHSAPGTSYPSSGLATSATHRRFSPARRLFCLLALFDFLATLFIWILYAHGLSGEFKEVIKSDVQKYNKKSLCDLVMLALWRMTVLLLAYALYVSRKWYAVGCPKDGTSAYLYYVPVLSSLILSWVEVWVFDFKVCYTNDYLLRKYSLECRKESEIFWFCINSVCDWSRKSAPSS